MTVNPGTRLGPYEILAPIGAGGMGEVYKATDTRLDRTVAIKVLPSHLSDNAELKQRFEREARAVSSLNHPHICTLHDIGEQDGVGFLVMEYLEGATLADRLMKGALPFDQALRCAIEIADALDKAHRQGVVHRDLKPGNIMLTKSGTKLLDFGLAKMQADVSAETSSMLSALPTEEKPLTEKGTILGTFQYMAPEQLEGKEADARTDIFAFGAVLYEIVTGRKAFEGKSQASLITAIMSAEPTPISGLQPLTPPALDWVVGRCLEKDSNERWQTACDLHKGLEWIVGGGVSDSVVAAPPGLRKRALTVGLALIMMAAVAGITVWSLTRPAPRPPKRFAITLPVTDQLDTRGVALSADGRDLVYIGWRGGENQLYRRSIDRLEVSPIRGTEGARAPFFSPDGEWVGFFADNELRKVSLAGGTPVTLCDAEPRYGADWGADDTITFSARAFSALVQVRAAGGAPQPITILNTDEGESHHCLPDVLPGGKAVLFTVRYGPGTDRIAVQALETGERKTLVDGTNPRYAPTGHIIFAKEQSLWAVPFDADRREVTGAPTPVLDGILVHWSGLASFAFAEDGSLVYVPGTSIGTERELVWVDREGRTISVVADRRANIARPRLSPDGRRLAVDDDRDVWVYDVERGTRTRLTMEGSNFVPVWTPDGKRVTFSSIRTGAANLYWKQADGSGEAEPLVTSEYPLSPRSWSPEGKLLAFSERKEGQSDIWMLPLEDDRVPVPFLVTPFYEGFPSFSPDGRWVAYVSDESGRNEVYVRPYPDPGGRVPISTDAGDQPVWCADGGELFYRNADRMMAVSVETQPTLEVGSPRVLFEGRYLAGPSDDSADYDVSPDCQRFVITSQAEGTMTQLNVVLNWFVELERLAPTSK